MSDSCARCFAAPVADVGICVSCSETNLCRACWDCEGDRMYSCCRACLPSTIDHQWAAMTPFGREQSPEMEPARARAALGIEGAAPIRGVLRRIVRVWLWKRAMQKVLDR